MKKSLKLISLFAAAAVFAAAFSGCAARGSAGKSAKSEYTIVTSFYPMYISALNVAGGVDGVKVVNMTKPTPGCLHD